LLFASIRPGSRGLTLIRPLVLLLFLGVGLSGGPNKPRAGIRQSGTIRPLWSLAIASLPSQPQIAGRDQDRSRIYRTRSGDTFWSIACRYRVSPYRLMQANPEYVPERLPIGARLRLPPAAGQPRATLVQPAWRWPIGGRITSRYGWRWGRMHKGVDIAAPPGTMVRAAEQGRVTFAGWRSGYGLYVTLTHPGGWRTAYGHNSRLLVHAGQQVSAGTTLARIGATGNATGIHLHFEVIGPGGYIDPLRVLK
jgi:murein DD-endopeptidase MepM/ murein hydrolase activator NlpD